MEGDSGGNNMNLPDELVFEILSRLPVKSLLRFKCICKSWLSTITQPQFINTHLCRSTESLDCHRVLLNTELFSNTFLSINFEASNSESKSLECPFENSDFSLQAQCSCNRLILMSVLVGGNRGTNPFVLWNPSTRSHKRNLCPYELPYCSLYGLCYDSAVDDYRVFIVSRRNEASVVVYSSRNDSWNIFIEKRYVLSSSKQQAVVNGAVHWVMSPYKSVSCVIVYFDLVEEKFKEVPPPSSWNKDDKMNLVVLGPGTSLRVW